MTKISAWDKAEKYNYNILDKIDLKPYLAKWKSINDIMEEIEDDAFLGIFEADVRTALEDPIMKNDIFNYIGTYEFMDYLKKRYGTEFATRTDIYVLTVENDINK